MTDPMRPTNPLVVETKPVEMRVAEPVPDRPGSDPSVVDRAIEVLPSGAIRTARLLLRPLVETDREAFVALVAASREHLARFSALHMPGESDEALFERQLRLTTDGERTGKACRRMLIDANGGLLGACNLNAIRRGLAWEGDLNLWLGATQTGKGLATEALAGLLRYAFADMPDGLGLHRVQGGIQAANHKSIRLAEGLGFEREGDEQSYLQTGESWDLHEMYTLTPERFSAKMAG